MSTSQGTPPATAASPSTSPRRYALYSVAASVATLILKFGAWWATGSVGLLSDALESVVNISAAVMALAAVTLAYRPADSDHAYGHGKAEYLSAGAEGLLILLAATGISWAAITRFMHPAELARLGPGLVVAVAAGLVNLLTARVMLKAAKRFDSITLEADARHLLTDVWTSAGLVAGLAVLLVAPPSWRIIDPILALVMAANIVRTGISLVRRSLGGLMDQSLPDSEIDAIGMAIHTASGGAHFHALRTRKAGPRRFIDFHLLLPGTTTVQESHDLCQAVETELKRIFPNPQITIHVEPVEDPKSHDGWMLGGTCSARVAGGDKECPKQDKDKKD